MIKACVMGFPAAHSLSPRLHGHWLKTYGIDGVYTVREVKPEGLAGALDVLTAEGFAGCNLTIPLKEAALPLMDVLDESAQAAGAVNTVVMKDGKKTGYNSDGFGFVESLNAQAAGWDKTHAVLYGAGGAARGIAASLADAGVEKFTFINRNAARAEALIRDLGIEGDVAGEVPEDASLFINCTPLGMKGQPVFALDISALSRGAVVCDIVYRPLVTPLLETARARGLRIVEGLPMLLHQGRLGFCHWFGTDPAVTKELYEEMALCAR